MAKKKTAKKKTAKKKTAKKKTAARDLPAVTAILTCDAVSSDPNSGKKTLYGLFDKFTPKQFPSTASFWVFVRFLGGRGSHDVMFILVGPRKKKVAESPTFSLKCSKNKKHDVIMNLAGVELRKKGTYSIEIAIDGRRRSVLEIQAEEWSDGQ
ncbi:MAG: hypothetical protein IID44_22900 [Planctomycetes bacterium]|nr:hypothetical protein [Planctomycetota bacterium]